MHERSALGAADVSDGELAVLVARALGCAPTEVDVVASTATVAPYDLEAPPTGGRYWVRGRARTPCGERSFSFFVKVVQTWARSPFFAYVPEQMREAALASLPWDVEPRIYRSDLGERLPDGLSMPAAYAVADLDEESAALWLEEVRPLRNVWDEARFARVAFLLGRLAGSPLVRPTARAARRGGERLVRAYAEGRVAQQLLPALRSDVVWSHPLVAGAFAPLRADLLGAADRLDAVVRELESLPAATLHGDACTRNVLVRCETQELVLIDFGFWGEGPVGFDLGQLLWGEVQMGERPASDLPRLEAACLPAYADGLHAEGSTSTCRPSVARTPCRCCCSVRSRRCRWSTSPDRRPLS
jgi:hypothetical protein